jgi:Icc-related predicted phosphoesterase
VGVLLCGDLYVRPALDARGGLGDVKPVWRAFARHFRWVAGVPGNHDAFGTPAERAAFAGLPRTHLLDGVAAVLDGMRVAGLGGIIGASGKPNRRDERAFLRELRALLGGRPELLLLHQGPDVPALRLVGDLRIRQVLERADEMLVLCGHVHWKPILAELSPRVQVANLEGRGLVLRTAPTAEVNQ